MILYILLYTFKTHSRESRVFTHCERGLSGWAPPAADPERLVGRESQESLIEEWNKGRKRTEGSSGDMNEPCE